MYIKAAKLGGLSAFLGIALHFFSHGYVALESDIASKFNQTKVAVVDDLATNFGYERKETLDALSISELAEKEALSAGLNPSLVRAVVHVESGGKEFAESAAGAIGVMQVMPFNTKRCDLTHYSRLFIAEDNIRCGVKILSQELKVYGGDIVKALQAYNGGARCVGKCSESLGYARMVLAKMSTDLR